MESFKLDKPVCRDIIDWMKAKGYSYNTIRQYTSTFKQLSIGEKEINNEKLRNIIKKFKHQNQRAVLYLINNYCFDKGIDFRLLIPKIKVKPRKIPQTLSPEEIRLMIDSAPHPFNLAIRCLYNMGAGLRISEIIKFSWSNIRWADWLSNQDNYGVALIKSAKGSKDRVVNIPSNLMKDLYKYAIEQNNLNESGIPTGGMIFQMGDVEWKKELKEFNLEQWKNEYITYAYDWFRYNILRKCCEKALNKHIKIHSLRSSRATYLYEIEKVPIERIQLLLGHSSIATTMIYTKVNPVSTFEMLKNTKEL